VRFRTEANRRWKWINGWLTAALHACIASLNLKPDKNLTISVLLSTYSKKVQNKLKNVPVEQVTADDWEINYIFQLEEELWGPDADRYQTFLPRDDKSTDKGKVELLQTFHFVLLFYIVERCLKLFVAPKERYQVGRKGLRRRVFGQEDGLLSKRVPGAAQAMGLPFSLTGLAWTVEVVGLAQREWDALKRSRMPDSLAKFYKATTGKEHFSDILEAALKQARRDHLKKAFGNKGKRLEKGVRAWWYDVLWHYSESIRYHALMPSDVGNPFYWNRTVRWFGSVIVTGLLLVAGHMGAPVNKVWQKRTGKIVQLLGRNGRF